jgi:hypothetical protein
MLVKLIAMGFLFNRGAYLRDPWNWLDFIVVVTGVLDMTGVVATASFLKLFRILRPLRAVIRIRKLKVLVQTMFGSLPQLCRVTAVLMFLLTFFGIIGLYVFKGRLQHGCFYLDGGESVATGDVCDAECQWDGRMQLKGPCTSLGNRTRGLGWAGSAWTCAPGQQCLCAASGADSAQCTIFDNPNTGIDHFDNIVWSIFTIFQSITLEGWVDIMYNLEDGGNALGVPGLGIVFQVLLRALIIMNLFLAVIADNFSIVESDEPPDVVDPGEAGSEDRAQTLARAVAEIRHTNPLRRLCLRLCTHVRFDAVIIGCILLNLVVMMLEFPPKQPDAFAASGASDRTDYMWPAYFWQHAGRQAHGHARLGTQLPHPQRVPPMDQVRPSISTPHPPSPCFPSEYHPCNPSLKFPHRTK